MSVAQVSIITPSLRQGHFIGQAIASVAAQDYPCIEYIIIDAGSDDETLSVIRSNERVISFWVSEPDTGTSEAINKGLSMASGDLVWMLNADDILVGSSAISSLVSFIKRYPEVDFVYGDMRVIDESGNPIGVRRFTQYGVDELLMDRRYLPFPGCLLKKTILEKIGRFDETLLYANDLDFFLRLAMNGKIVHLPCVTGAFRIHGKASTQANVADSGEEVMKVSKRYLNIAKIQGRLRFPVSQIEAAIASFGASFSFHSGRSQDVRRYTAEAFSLWPHSLADPKLWVYLAASAFGDDRMQQISSIARRLVNRPGIFDLNNISVVI